MTVREAILTLRANAVFACEKAGFTSATVKMVEDALDIIDKALQAHEPRVMTEEEVLSQPEGAVVWRECHLSNGQYELRPMVCDGKGCCGDFGLSAECKYDFSYRYYVRYWTNKPTEEQREATPWHTLNA